MTENKKKIEQCRAEPRKFRHCLWRLLVYGTWRFTGSYKWGYKGLKKGYKYSYLTYNPTYNYP